MVVLSIAIFTLDSSIKVPVSLVKMLLVLMHVC